MPLINIGIGVSQKDNLIEAAKEAAQKAKEELEDKKPKLLMFFLNYVYPYVYPKEDYQKAINEIYNVFKDKDVPFVGGPALGFFAKYMRETILIKRALKEKDTPIFGLCSAGETAFYKSGSLFGATATITMMGISNRLIAKVEG